MTSVCSCLCYLYLLVVFAPSIRPYYFEDRMKSMASHMQYFTNETGSFSAIQLSWVRLVVGLPSLPLCCSSTTTMLEARSHSYLAGSHSIEFCSFLHFSILYHRRLYFVPFSRLRRWQARLPYHRCRT